MNPAHDTALRKFELDRALVDPGLFAEALGPPGSWETWLVILRGFYGLPLDANQLEVFNNVAHSRKAPTEPCTELWVQAGRRGGKSRVAGAILAYHAMLGVFGGVKLAAGETGWCVSFSPKLEQAKSVLNYAYAFIDMSPVFQDTIIDRTTEEIRLRNDIVISVQTANYRHIRGKTLLCAVLDESAHLRSEESAIPDLELVRAVKPALKKGAPLVGISSPFAKRGVLWQRHQSAYGKDGPVLYVKADTMTLNPTFDQSIIDEEYELDPVSARTEYAAEFRDDIAGYIREEILRRCTSTRAAYAENSFRSFAFVDPSGGASDSFSLGISHVDGEEVILNAVHEWPAPFTPDDVIDEIDQILAEYRCASVHGDNYGAEWVASAFRKRGLTYLKSPGTRTELYLEALPLFTGQTATIPNDPVLIAQLCSLERRTTPNGREAIDHPTGMKDDVANAAAGALVVAARTRHQAKRKPFKHEGLDNYNPLAW